MMLHKSRSASNDTSCLSKWDCSDGNEAEYNGTTVCMHLGIFLRSRETKARLTSAHLRGRNIGLSSGPTPKLSLAF
jgi:hypothetical protein